MQKEEWYDLTIKTADYYHGDFLEIYRNVAKSCMTPEPKEFLNSAIVTHIHPNAFSKWNIHPCISLPVLGFKAHALYFEDIPIGRFISRNNQVFCSYAHQSELDPAFVNDCISLYIYEKFTSVDGFDLSGTKTYRCSYYDVLFRDKGEMIFPIPCIDGIKSTIKIRAGTGRDREYQRALLSFGPKSKGIDISLGFYKYGGYLLKREIESGVIEEDIRIPIRPEDVEGDRP